MADRNRELVCYNAELADAMQDGLPFDADTAC